MELGREELVRAIESARSRLNESIDGKERYEQIYQNSVEKKAVNHLIFFEFFS